MLLATIFIFTKMSTPIVRPTKPLIQWVLAVLPWGKVMGQEADLSPSSSAEIKNGWSCISMYNENFAFACNFSVSR
jgi:hypothetical protein